MLYPPMHAAREAASQAYSLMTALKQFQRDARPGFCGWGEKSLLHDDKLAE